MTSVVNTESIIFVFSFQDINGEEHISYDIYANLEDENGNPTAARVKIGEIGPDLHGELSWIRDRELTIFDGFLNSDEIHSYVEERISRLRFDAEGGFETLPTVGEG